MEISIRLYLGIGFSYCFLVTHQDSGKFIQKELDVLGSLMKHALNESVDCYFLCVENSSFLLM